MLISCTDCHSLEGFRRFFFFLSWPRCEVTRWRQDCPWLLSLSWRYYHLAHYLLGIYNHFFPFKSQSGLLSANASVCAELLNSKSQVNTIRKEKQPLERQKERDLLHFKTNPKYLLNCWLFELFLKNLYRFLSSIGNSELTMV